MMLLSEIKTVGGSRFVHIGLSEFEGSEMLWYLTSLTSLMCEPQQVLGPLICTPGVGVGDCTFLRGLL